MNGPPPIGRHYAEIHGYVARRLGERAAVAAERKTFTPPRPDQWFYFEDRFTAPEGTFTQEGWRRADGGAIASMSKRTGGRLEIQTIPRPERKRIPPAFGPLASYEAVARLPTDPAALRRWAYGLAKNITGAGVNDDGDVYAIFNGMLLALAQTEDWLEEELLLDARTYAYLGERSTVVKDTVVSPEKAGNATGRIAKGHKVVVERLASGIVDEAGRRP